MHYRKNAIQYILFMIYPRLEQFLHHHKNIHIKKVPLCIVLIFTDFVYRNRVQKSIEHTNELFPDASVL